MSTLLSSASGIVTLFVILCAAGLVLKRRISVALTALAFLPFAAPLFFFDMLVPSRPDAPWEFPYACLLFFLPVYGLYSNTAPEKLFAFFSQLFAGCVMSSLASFSARAFLPILGAGYEALRLGVLAALGGLYLYWLAGHGRRLSRELFSQDDGWVWAAYAFGPCLGCALLPMALWPDIRDAAGPVFFPLLLLFALWSMSVLILAILATRARTQAAFDMDLARRILNAGTAQSGEMAQMVETARILRHDCKHHLHVAQVLLETGHLEEARKYLLTFGTKCDEGVLPMFCSNPAVNALLTGYLRRCREADIDFSAAVELPEDPPMDSFELCTLLGNLLENALEACRKAPQGQRRIFLKGAPQGSQLLISVKNGFDGAVLQQEGHIVSRKGACGGLGIKSIRAIASRHQGEYIPQWEGHTFTASVMLKL